MHDPTAYDLGSLVQDPTTCNLAHLLKVPTAYDYLASLMQDPTICNSLLPVPTTNNFVSLMQDTTA